MRLNSPPASESLKKVNVWEESQTFKDGCIVSNVSSPDGGAYKALRNDGVTPQVLLTLNGANNLDIGGDQLAAYCGFGCSIVMRVGKVFTLESYDISEDLYVLQADNINNLLIGNDVFTGSTQINDTHFRVMEGRRQRWFESLDEVMRLESDRLGVRPGTSINKFANVGGVLFDHYSTVSSTDTNGTENDLYSDDIAPSSFGRDGDKVTLRYAGSFVGHATATRRLRLYFGGTSVLDTTALVSSSASNWVLEATFIRASSSVVRYNVTLIAPGLASVVPPSVGEVTGLTLTNAQTLRLTGTAAAAGAASGDISALNGTVNWHPAATVLTVPLSLLPVAWWKADAGAFTAPSGGFTAATNNDDLVGMLRDQTGNGRHLYQPTTEWRGLLKTNVQNGLPCVRMDGTDNFLRMTALNVPQPCSVYLVARMRTNGNFSFFRTDDGGFSGGSFFNSLASFAGVNFIGPAIANNTNVFTLKFVYNGASSKLRVNENAESTDNVGGSGMGALSFGADFDGTAASPIDFHEALLFDRILTVDEDTAVTNYLQARWGHY